MRNPVTSPEARTPGTIGTTGSENPVGSIPPRPLGLGTARVGWVRALPQVLRELGLDAERLLAESGIEPSAFDDEQGAIGFRPLGRLFERAVRASGCPHPGLLIGERFDPSAMREVSRLMAQSPTVGAALRALILRFHVLDEGAVPMLLPSSPGRTVLAHSVYEHDVPALDQFADLAACIAVRTLGSLCGSGFRPLQVSLPHRPPEDPAPYRRILGAPVKFNARFAAVAFSSAWLELPAVGGDAKTRASARAWVDFEFPVPSTPLSHQLRRALRPMVLTGTATEPAAARLFSLHPRTLRRELRAEGATFLALVNETRLSIAQQLLRDTDLRVAEIAATLHYSDATAFTRAFRAQVEYSPMEWRRRARTAKP